MMRVLVTGASGFVGRFVRAALVRAGAEAVSAVRQAQPAPASGASIELGPESTSEQMRRALNGIDAVIHLAAFVHDMSGRTSASDYQRINRDYPLAIGRAASAAGARRFVFVSTIKVNGDGTGVGQSYTEASGAAPSGPYAESKWQAERGLSELSGETSLVTRIVRPPLVYGPGVRANFLSLMRWVRRGVPLPFARVDNARSLIYVENLADVLVRLALARDSAELSRTYLVSDGEDLSTPELIRRLARALRVRPRLVPVPASLLRGSLSLLGRGAAAERLMGSLRVDSSLVRRELAWRPLASVDEGLVRTAAWLDEGA